MKKVRVGTYYNKLDFEDDMQKFINNTSYIIENILFSTSHDNKGAISYSTMFVYTDISQDQAK